MEILEYIIHSIGIFIIWILVGFNKKTFWRNFLLIILACVLIQLRLK